MLNHWEQFGISFRTLENTESSAEHSVFSRLCHFRLSVARMFLKLAQDNATPIRNIILGMTLACDKDGACCAAVDFSCSANICSIYQQNSDRSHILQQQ